MTELNEIYKCEMCGNIVALVHSGPGELVCCGTPMILMEEKTAEMKLEKHVPVIERDGDLIKVYVGSTLHPMEENHYIEWIELIADGRRQRKYLKPGDPPEALFLCRGETLSAREYCNVHGLWKN
ncbi:MAG: desulfoferrodoxin [Thermoplasmata archaeon]|nr:desulfoferrodoxin [Thermoplasmata archaeon]MCK5397499.1 desulfoferrodoxin [Thermoplasmata archaeon]